MTTTADARDKCRTGAIVLQNRDTGALLFLPTVCRRWSCPYCSCHRYWEARAKAVAGRPERFITLTLRPAPRVPLRARIEFIRKSWRRLLQRIRRVWGPMQWFAALELQKNGSPHLHILQRGTFIDQDWLSRAWRRITGDFIVDIREVEHVPGAVSEITKYLTKTAAQIEDQAPGMPVFTHSKHWLPHDFDDDSDPPGQWDFKEWIGGGWSRMRDTAQSLGAELVPESPGSRAYLVQFSRAPPPDLVDALISDGSFSEATIASLLEAEYRRQTTGQGDPTDALARVDYARECTREIPAPFDPPELSCPNQALVPTASLW